MGSASDELAAGLCVGSTISQLAGELAERAAGRGVTGRSFCPRAAAAAPSAQPPPSRLPSLTGLHHPAPAGSVLSTVYAWVSVAAVIITALLLCMNHVLRRVSKPFTALDLKQRVVTTFHASYVLLYAGCAIPMTYYGARWWRLSGSSRIAAARPAGSAQAVGRLMSTPRRRRLRRSSQAFASCGCPPATTWR